MAKRKTLRGAFALVTAVPEATITQRSPPRPGLPSRRAWLARCPCCMGQLAWLVIGERIDETVYIACAAGCSPGAVAKAAGLDFSVICSAGESSAARRPEDWIDFWHELQTAELNRQSAATGSMGGAPLSDGNRSLH